MKFLKILCLSPILLSTLISAQDLAGTTWIGIDDAPHDTVIIEFSLNDTIYLEDSILLDVPVATYEIVAGQLNFTDLGENSLCQMTPATYNIEIESDRLVFLPVNDPCENRRAVLTQYQWSLSEEHVHNKVRTGDISIYPSPYDLSVYLDLPAWFDRSEYKIFRLSQQLMKQGEITRESPKIDVSDIPDGNYILFLDINQQTYRLIIDQTLRR
jgi:hypothetical protein